MFNIQSSAARTTKTYLLGLSSISIVTLTALTGCQKPQDNTATTTSATQNASVATAKTTPTSGKISVYASTNVWGSVAKAVGGDNVDVIIAVNDPTQDPHDYQASATDKLNVSKSSIVLVNGGGYDDWTTSLAKSVDNKPVIINAVNLSGLAPESKMAEHDESHDEAAHKEQAEHEDHDAHEPHASAAHEAEPHDAHDTTHADTPESGHDHDEEGEHHHHSGFNEHVFFSLDTAKKVAQAVANELSQRDPANKAKYSQNANDFMQKIDTLKTKAQAVGQGKNITVFATEPVTGYLLADMGIKDITPKGYIEQSETDAGVSVKIMNDSQNLIKTKQASMLIVNAQTEDATSKQLVTLAEQSSIPVVSAYETFPQGITTYTDFMEKTIDSIAVAVKQ